MKQKRSTISELEGFKKNFKAFIQDKISYLNDAQPIPAKKVIIGDVISFKSRLNLSVVQIHMYIIKMDIYAVKPSPS